MVHPHKRNDRIARIRLHVVAVFRIAAGHHAHVAHVFVQVIQHHFGIAQRDGKRDARIDGVIGLDHFGDMVRTYRAHLERPALQLAAIVQHQAHIALERHHAARQRQHFQA
ncbi:hypothetical protein D3C71_1376570 [compost metagenome]